MEKIQEIQDVCKEVLIILGYLNNDILEKIPSRIFKKLNELAADSKLNYYIDISQKNCNRLLNLINNIWINTTRSIWFSTNI